MREQPLGPELLAIAGKVLREELLPLLPREKHYQALMLANAMAIAARQLAAGDGPAQAELARLQTLLDVSVDSTLTLHDQLLTQNSLLAQTIRARSSTLNAAQLAEHLWQTTCDKARESAPKALDGL